MAWEDLSAEVDGLFSSLGVADPRPYFNRDGFGLDRDSLEADPGKLARDRLSRRRRRADAFAEVLRLRRSHCLNSCANLLPISKSAQTAHVEYCSSRCREEARWPRRNLAKWTAMLARRPAHCQRPQCCNLLRIAMGNGVAQARYCSVKCGDTVRRARKRAHRQLSGR
jgi:hypothetical protein